MHSLVSTLAAYTLASHHKHPPNHSEPEMRPHHPMHPMEPMEPMEPMFEDGRDHVIFEISFSDFFENHPLAKLFEKIRQHKKFNENKYLGKFRHRVQDFSYGAKSTLYKEMNLPDLEQCLYAQQLFRADQELGWTEILRGEDRKTKV